MTGAAIPANVLLFLGVAAVVLLILGVIIWQWKTETSIVLLIHGGIIWPWKTEAAIVLLILGVATVVLMFLGVIIWPWKTEAAIVLLFLGVEVTVLFPGVIWPWKTAAAIVLLILGVKWPWKTKSAIVLLILGFIICPWKREAAIVLLLHRFIWLLRPYNFNGIVDESEVLKIKNGIPELDLHWQRLWEAREVTQMFLQHSLGRHRLVRIITGRGLHSRGGIPRIKPEIETLLSERGYKFQKIHKGGCLKVYLE